MNANEKHLPGESVIDDAELASARGGALTVDWDEILERLKKQPPLPPTAPTWPGPTPLPFPPTAPTGPGPTPPPFPWDFPNPIL